MGEKKKYRNGVHNLEHREQPAGPYLAHRQGLHGMADVVEKAQKIKFWE